MSGINSKTVLQICEHCKKEFFACRDQVNRGRGKCCSLSCAASKPRRPLAVRFWKKVNKTENCWIWAGAFNSFGYGVIWTGKRKTLATHASWAIAGRVIPNGLCLLHNCPGGDNPACVNPSHLFLGTKGDNNKDRAAKGRNRDQRGEKNEKAILTARIVLEIRARFAAGGITQRALAREYGIHFGTVSGIICRMSWRHV